MITYIGGAVAFGIFLHDVFSNRSDVSLVEKWLATLAGAAVWPVILGAILIDNRDKIMKRKRGEDGVMSERNTTTVRQPMPYINTGGCSHG